VGVPVGRGDCCSCRGRVFGQWCWERVGTARRLGNTMLLSPGVAFESGSASRRRDAWLGGLRC
jgi:hypothetical protein